MIRTAKWPFRKTGRGGLQRTSATDGGKGANRQLIILAHLAGKPGNPFLTHRGVGGIDPSFGVGGAAITGRAVVHSQDFFSRLEAQGRARLLPGYPRIEPSAEEGKYIVAIEYEDLETGQHRREEVG